VTGTHDRTPICLRGTDALAAMGYQGAACPVCADKALGLLRAAHYPEAEELLTQALRLHAHHGGPDSAPILIPW
jgi:hypothetical protein